MSWRDEIKRYDGDNEVVTILGQFAFNIEEVIKELKKPKPNIKELIDKLEYDLDITIKELRSEMEK
tara:strand:+ start:187 stop:384 length:198 start_codon:yes stop_codon:yes gene_type:complete